MDDAERIAMQNGYRMVRCRNCGLIYVDPRPPREMLISLYDSYHQRGRKDMQSWKALMSRNFEEIADLIDMRYPSKGNLLDVGCGYGHFIEIMQSREWKATGIEPSEETSANARARGLDIKQTALEDALFHEGSFDAITAFYVLEHLYDPLDALNKMYKLLKKGGMLVIRVPHTTPIVRLLNLFGIENNLYDMPFHLYDFSPSTVKSMLEKAGFAGIRVTPGSPTMPPGYAERLISLLSGHTARLLHTLSKGKILLPGVSKTVFALKLDHMPGSANA